MEITQKAIAKALSSQGTHVLSRTDVLCTLLDDMVPGQIEDLQSIKMVYTDEIGHMLSEASQAPFSDKEKYYREIDKYLQDQRGSVESIRTRFINVFRDTFRRKTVEVIKYKDYKPALSILKQEFGPYVSDDVIHAFIEENRLFYRFSLTVDDVKRDIKTV